MIDEVTRPILGIENRTAQEVFDIMVERVRRARSRGAALSPGSTGETEVHGPFGYLVCPIGLDESHWRFEDDPVKDEEYVCLPVFTKEDPFERVMTSPEALKGE